MNDLSIVLINYNGSIFLNECLNSIQKMTNHCHYEAIVVDNCSTDDSTKIIKDKFPSFQLICSQTNLGFGKANNLAVKYSQGKYLLFLNTDTILTENTVKILSDYLDRHEDVGAIGSRVVFEDSSYQLSAGKLPSIGIELIDKIRYALDRRWHSSISDFYSKQHSQVAEVGWVTGACLMMRRDLFDRIGGFDEKFFMYFEDKDLCKRVREAGFKVIYYPHTSIIHLLGGSSQGVKKSVNTYYRDSQLYYYQKHLGRFQTGVLKLYLRISGKI
jgi:N-acetylglucosaminyl-diphospho-decaprenol L-rhamnosyltransferase